MTQKRRAFGQILDIFIVLYNPVDTFWSWKDWLSSMIVGPTFLVLPRVRF